MKRIISLIIVCMIIISGMFMYNRARYSASGELVMDHSKAMGGSVGGAVGAAAATAALSFVPYVIDSGIPRIQL